jgi:diguanylate cyclase (GGDEF)-like protein/PAS domain S-box-containing protein
MLEQTGSRWRSEAPFVIPGVAGAAILLWALGRAGVAAANPLWLVILILAIATIVSYAVDNFYGACPRWQIHLRIAAKVLAVAACVYMTGWGPMLMVGLLYPVADTLENFGTGATAAALGWVVVAVAMGQTAIAFRIAPSFVRPSTTQGLGALALAGLVAAALYLRIAIVRRSDAQQALAREQERFRELVRNSSDLTFVVGADGTIEYASPSARWIDAPSPPALASLATAVHPDDAEVLEAMFDRVRPCHGAMASDEVRLHHTDGSWRWVELVATNMVGNPAVGGLILNGRDVTDRKLAESDLAIRATHDPLTGAPNRVLLLERLEHALGRTARGNGAVGVLYIDLDRFKEVNDRFGHDVGDLVLVRVVERLTALLRRSDTLARAGGDEFVVLLDPEDTTSSQEMTERARTVAERVIACCDEPIEIQGEAAKVGASVGICVGRAPRTAHELLRAADLAMYRAKEEGRGRFTEEPAPGESGRSGSNYPVGEDPYPLYLDLHQVTWL